MMKKRILTAICCMALTAASVMAQEAELGQRGSRMRGGMRGGAEPQLADTTITNHMGLTDEQNLSIAKLNNEYKLQLTTSMRSRGDNGKRMSREEREAAMDKIKELKAEGRKQLRVILGDELYISYLEQSLDRMPAFGMMRGGMREGGFGQGGPRGGQGGAQHMMHGAGGFGGGGFGGGDFGSDF